MSARASRARPKRPLGSRSTAIVIGDFSVDAPALPWLRPPRKLWSSSTTPLSNSRSGRTMARRSLCSHAQAVSYEPNPKASCKPRAETPFFCEVTNQIAANQVDNGVCERWKIVPAVAEVFSPHSRRTSTALGPCASSHRCRSVGTRIRAASAVQPDTPDMPARRGTRTGTPDTSADSHAHRPDADRQPRPHVTALKQICRTGVRYNEHVHSRPAARRGELHGTAVRYAGEERDLAESIAELREMANGRDDILAEVVGGDPHSDRTMITRIEP